MHYESPITLDSASAERLVPLSRNYWANAQPIEIAAPIEQERGRFGFGVLGIADVNHDGIGDLAVATTEKLGDVKSAGSVYILSGRDYSVVRRLVSPQPATGPSYGFGTATAEVPDLEGDGVPELVVTSMQEDRAYIFSGASGKLLQTLGSPVSRLGSWRGMSAASLGTTHPNARPRVVIGTPGAAGEQGDMAKVHVFDPATGEVLFSVANPGPKRWFGVSLANIGDMDGDGREDMAVGAGSPVPPYYSGAAYVISGEAGKLLYELHAPLAASTSFAWTVAAVPDVNGDGKSDLLVGIGGSAQQGAPANRVMPTCSAARMANCSARFSLRRRNGMAALAGQLQASQI